MFDSYIVEIRPRPVGVTVQAGIVVRDGRRFRFFAATHAFNSLEGQLFETPEGGRDGGAAPCREDANPTDVVYRVRSV